MFLKVRCMSSRGFICLIHYTQIASLCAQFALYSLHDSDNTSSKRVLTLLSEVGVVIVANFSSADGDIWAIFLSTPIGTRVSKRSVVVGWWKDMARLAVLRVRDT